MGDLRKLLGDRIRQARIRLSFTQQQLAEQAGLSSAQVMSQVEKGERDVKAWELYNLAKILRMEISQLLTEESSEVYVPVLWRQTPSKDKQLIEADFLNHCYRYALLEKICNVSTSKELPNPSVDFDTMSFDEAEELGEEIRNQLNLGSRPACALSEILEDQFRVKIWYEDLGEASSAASTKGSFGCAVLINSIEPPWRRNFSFAHELFHIITWDSIDLESLENNIRSNTKMEKLANAFAAGVLLPIDEVREAFQKRITDNRITYADLLDVAREFDVSAEVLLYRLINLGAISRDKVDEILNTDEFIALTRSYRIKDWAMPPEIPERFVLLAFQAYQKGKLARPRLAEYLGTSLVELTDTLLEYGLDDRESYETEVLTSGL